MFGGNGEDKLWDAVRGDKPVALLFTGRVVGKGWQGNFKDSMPPVFGALTKEFKETVFSQTVDIFRHSRFAEQLGVRAIPTVLFVRAGREIERFEGPVSERTLRYYLRRVSAEHTGGPLPGADDGETVAPDVETEAPSLPKRFFGIFRK